MRRVQIRQRTRLISRSWPGRTIRERFKNFNRILYQVQFYTLSANIIAPPGSRDVTLGMSFGCTTCVHETEQFKIIVHLIP